MRQNRVFYAISRWAGCAGKRLVILTGPFKKERQLEQKDSSRRISQKPHRLRFRAARFPYFVYYMQKIRICQ